jgi:hypothetical protein
MLSHGALFSGPLDIMCHLGYASQQNVQIKLTPRLTAKDTIPPRPNKNMFEYKAFIYYIIYTPSVFKAYIIFEKSGQIKFD